VRNQRPQQQQRCHTPAQLLPRLVRARKLLTPHAHVLPRPPVRTALCATAKQIGASFDLVKKTREMGRLPVVNFAAGGVATPADAALMMQLGVDGVFVGSGIFKSGNPAKRAAAIVEAVTHYKDPQVLATVSTDLGEAMVGLNCDQRQENWAQRESGQPPKQKYREFDLPSS
jgi:pyridoxal 5'-phosphate synthase subunit Pdx1